MHSHHAFHMSSETQFGNRSRDHWWPVDNEKKAHVGKKIQEIRREDEVEGSKVETSS